jgi:hypothetical protein
MPFILEFRPLPPSMQVNFAAMRAHDKYLGGIKSDGVHVPIPLTVKERPFIPAQPDTFVTWRPIFFQTVNIDDQLDTFGLFKPT